MKNWLLSAAFIAVCHYCNAQYISVDTPKYKIVRKDTINIRGIVLDAFDKPVFGVQVHSKNTEMVFYGLPIYTITDKEGKFQLKGALVKDTLDIWWQKTVNIINNGSRYIEIHLPMVEQNNDKTTGNVSAKRQIEKRDLPVFKVLTNAQVMDYFGVSTFNSFDPVFYRNKQKLSDYVAQRVVYPQKAIENNIEGEVEIGFSIERDGTPFNYRVIRGVGYGCEDAVINVIMRAPKWKPAFINGRPFVGQSSVVINFKLTDK